MNTNNQFLTVGKPWTSILPVVVAQPNKTANRTTLCWSCITNLGLYYISELELKSNSSEILPVNCKFICVHTRIVRFYAESQTYKNLRLTTYVNCKFICVHTRIVRFYAESQTYKNVLSLKVGVELQINLQLTVQISFEFDCSSSLLL